jgi:hypothetical protein
MNYKHRVTGVLPAPDKATSAGERATMMNSAVACKSADGDLRTGWITLDVVDFLHQYS